MPSETGDLILGFDSSGPWIRAALIRGDALQAEVDLPMPKGQAEALMPALEALLTGAGCHWADLQALGVGTGPGNFTGVRIAVAAARGLALGLGIPAIGVDRFDAAALDAGEAPVAVPALRGQFWLRTDGTVSAVTDLPGNAVTDETALVPLAQAIARLAAQRLPQASGLRPTPVYMRPADAAPPSDTPPVLLDG